MMSHSHHVPAGKKKEDSRALYGLLMKRFDVFSCSQRSRIVSLSYPWPFIEKGTS